MASKNKTNTLKHHLSQPYRMKYLPIDQQLFIENRRKLAARMKPGSIAIFNSNDIMPTNADGTMLFRQNNDLFIFQA